MTMGIVIGKVLRLRECVNDTVYHFPPRDTSPLPDCCGSCQAIYQKSPHGIATDQMLSHQQSKLPATQTPLDPSNGHVGRDVQKFFRALTAQQGEAIVSEDPSVSSE